MPNSWDHKQGYGHKLGKSESAKAYKAFTCYLELGDQRSLRKVEAILGMGFNHLQDFQKHYAWTDRAAAYDAAQVKARFNEVRGNHAREHRAAIEAFRIEQERRAESMGMLADLMLDMTMDKLNAMRAGGEYISEQSIANVSRTVASLAEMSMNLKATALGVDDLAAALDVAED